MSLAPTLISSGLHRAGVSVLCPRCFGASSLRNHPVVRSRRGLVNEITPCYRFHFLAPLIQAMSRRGHGRDRMEHIGTWIVSAETMCRLQWTLPAIIGATMSGRGQPTAIVLTLPDDCPLLWDCSYAVPRRRKAASRPLRHLTPQHDLRRNTLGSAQPRRLRVSLFVPRADEPASTVAQFDFIKVLKMRHFLNPSRFW